jgi:hypothetical protein
MTLVTECDEKGSRDTDKYEQGLRLSGERIIARGNEDLGDGSDRVGKVRLDKWRVSQLQGTRGSTD